MVIINDKIIGQRIQTARLQKKLSQSDLADLLDVSVSYVSRIECGKIRLNLERIIELCLILNISLPDILQGSYSSTEVKPINNTDCPSKERLLQLINTATPKALGLMQEICESVCKIVT